MGEGFYLSKVFQILGQTQQQDFTLFFVNDGPAAEKYVGLNLETIFQEFD
ncbi:MAG: hypothetical protein RLZZ114_277, partial [Bacteroidota bacterium]